MKKIVDVVYDVVFFPVTCLDYFARFEWLKSICGCCKTKKTKKSKAKKEKTD